MDARWWCWGRRKPPEPVSSMNMVPEAVLWDTSRRQAVEPLAIRLPAWGQTKKKKKFVFYVYITSVKSICSLAFFFFTGWKILMLKCFAQPIMKGWFWQTSTRFSTFLHTVACHCLSNGAHGPVNRVGGDPRCCTEEGICHIAGVPLPGLQEERLCQTLKMCCRLVVSVCWHYLLFFFFWHTGRSRKAPQLWPSPTLGTSERARRLFQDHKTCVESTQTYHKTCSFFTWTDAVLTLDTYKYCNILAMVVMAGRVSNCWHYCEEITNIHCCILRGKKVLFDFYLCLFAFVKQLILKKPVKFML